MTVQRVKQESFPVPSAWPSTRDPGMQVSAPARLSRTLKLSGWHREKAESGVLSTLGGLQGSTGVPPLPEQRGPGPHPRTQQGGAWSHLDLTQRGPTIT